MSLMVRKLTLGRLPRVMVRILALDEDTRSEVAAEVAKALNETSIKGEPVAADDLPDAFAAVLDLSKVERRRFAHALDRSLDALATDDLFGTECQNDPRGDAAAGSARN